MSQTNEITLAYYLYEETVYHDVKNNEESFLCRPWSSWGVVLSARQSQKRKINLFVCQNTSKIVLSNDFTYLADLTRFVSRPDEAMQSTYFQWYLRTAYVYLYVRPTIFINIFIYMYAILVF